MLNSTTKLLSTWMPDSLDAIYGAIIGGGIALATAILTNRHARKQQAIDIRHQSAEREKERLHELRREIYIPLIQATTDAVMFVAQTPTMPMAALQAQQPVMDLARHVARLSLIAPRSVQEPAQLNYQQLIRLHMELFVARLAIEQVAGDLSTADLGIQLRLNRQKELLTRQDKHIDERTATEAMLAHIGEQLKVANDEVMQLINQKKALNEKKALMEIALHRRASESLVALRQRGCDTLLAIRNDLGLPLDEKWLREFSKAQLDDALASALKFQDQIEAYIRVADSKFES